MARRRAGLTQRELADRLGCRQATVARWERGDRQVSVEDVQTVATACGLKLDSHLVVDDRSWWPQIAMHLDVESLDRVRRLTPADAPDIAGTVGLIAALDLPVIVIGQVAGALHGWPLLLREPTIELCVRGSDLPAVTEALSAAEADHRYELATGVRLAVTETPPGTSGFGDLTRGAVSIPVGADSVQVAGLLDLLRIAEALPAPTAYREALAYQAVLDVERARSERPGPDRRTAEERIEAWLQYQTPAA